MLSNTAADSESRELLKFFNMHHQLNYVRESLMVVICGMEILSKANCSASVMLNSYPKRPGPSCSKLTTSLANVTLKFQTYYT